MGLVILVTFFVLPFYSASSLYGNASATLYDSFMAAYSSLSLIQAAGNTTATTAIYLLLIASILILISGFVGVFPLGTGVLGIVGMAIITVAPYLIVPGVVLDFSGYGVGFYVVWAASIIALGASFWHGKRQTGTGGTVQQQVTVQPATKTS